MRSSLSPDAYHRISGIALGLLAMIVVTGGAVRLTGSGLGCSDWPTCEQDQVIPEAEFHGWVEFGNRLLTGLVSVVVVLAVLGSMARNPRRSDLVRLSWGLVAGVLAQIVLGGIVVLSHLNPWLVLGHFALSMVLIGNAVVLRHRSGDHLRVARPPTPTPSDRLRSMATGITLFSVVVLTTGTFVTGSGPHTGSRDDPIPRLPFRPSDIARVHGTTVVLFLVMVAALALAVRRDPTGERLRPRMQALGAVVVLQAAIGWTQYFTGVPELLVGLHLAGATALWATVVSLGLEAREHLPVPEGAPA